tara:strand:+ start:215 stop:1207 length:993 start_codon:yes stop_codon:yes gene_type:complete
MISKKYLINGSILISIFTLLFFREYLYTYRMMLTNFVPYELYQNQVLYFSTFNEEYKLTIPAAIRLIPILFYFIIYKTIPCFKLTNINEAISNDYICATNAVAIGNYLILVSILVIFLFYQVFVLGKSKQEGYLSMVLCYAILKYLDHFAIDRFVVLYLILILFFINNLKFSIILIIFSFMVSEKIFFITGFLFFLRFIFQNNKKKYLILFLSSIFACIFYFILVEIGKNYFDFFKFNFDYKQMVRMFYDKSAISGSLLPLLISLSPYIFWNKEINKNFKNQRIEFLIPLSLIFFGFLGGVENTARYVTHSFPIWLPILTSRINQLLKFK